MSDSKSGQRVSLLRDRGWLVGAPLALLVGAGVLAAVVTTRSAKVTPRSPPEPGSWHP
jgi:hypothetical protein